MRVDYIDIAADELLRWHQSCGNNWLMGRLHPANFNLLGLLESEARVVQALVDSTTSEWIIMPTVHLPEKPPVEIDIVVAHPVHGVGIIEVKGFTPKIVTGEWISPYQNDSADPPAQLRRNRYALRDFLRELIPSERNLQVDAAIAFVNARGFAGDARPTQIEPEQLIWADDLDSIDSSLLRFMNRGRPGTLMYGEGVFAKIVRAIRPDVDFDPAPDAYMNWASSRIENFSGAQVRALERLDANRKVFVTGGAGTGKSRLALAWTRRAAMRGERVLLVCFNEPLGAQFARRVGDMDGVTVGPFLPLALSFEGIPPLPVPPDAGREFWNNTVQGHLHLHWPDVEARFDTIVVDESQDFSPSWLTMLEQLLDPDGPRRMLLTGDADQELHNRGFTPPRPEDGWTLCELFNNTRNSRDIARLMRKRLNGPPAPFELPDSTHVRFTPVEELSELVAQVRAEVLRLRENGFADDGIAVLCVDTAARDALRDVPMFVPFEQAGEGRIVCETSRRVKGLEYQAVILAGSRWPVDDIVLYVGVSRAVFGLSVIGPRELGEHLALGE